MAAAPSRLSGKDTMVAAVASICPRCAAPFVERDAFTYTCALGHSLLHAQVEPVAGGTVPSTAAAPTAAPPALLPAPRPVYRSAADIRPARVSWLWPGRIPCGKITVLDGDPGLGKSLLTLDLAARVTTGRPMPECATGEAPRSVVLLCNEDDPADTVLPRLEAAAADVSRVTILEAALEGEAHRETPFVLPAHLSALDELVARHHARLVVIDPLMAYLDGGVNTHRDQAIRRALLPVQMLAQRRGCAVVLVRHLNKAAGMSALYRGGGSIGIVGAARSALLVAPDPVDPRRRVLAPLKSNLASRPDTLAYQISGDPPHVEWLGAVAVTADTLLGGVAPTGSAAPSREDEARAWLERELAGGPHGAQRMLKEAERRGFSASTLRRARVALGVTITKSGFGETGQWVWTLPPNEGENREPRAGNAEVADEE